MIKTGIDWTLSQLGRRKGDIWLLSARWSTPVLGLFGGLIAARFLAPEEFGVVQAVMLIPVYFNFMHFGVFNGLNRNLPLFRSTGAQIRAQNYVDASARTARWVGLIGILVGGISALAFYLKSENPTFGYVALFLIPCLYFGPKSLHLETVYRGTRNFEYLGKVVHLRNIWLLVCSISTAFIGITGLALKIGTNGLFSFIGLRGKVPLKDTRSATFGDIKDLSAVGFPMLISGLLFAWLVAADKTVIATLMDPKDLGFFALASMTMNAIQVLPSSINQLLYPRVAEAYGKSGSSRCLGRYIWIGLFLNLILITPVVLIGWIAIPIVVNGFLPAYSPGIDAARIALLGSVFFAYSGPSVIIPILRKNLAFQVAAAIAIGLVWIGGFLAIRLGYGIEGVAWVRVCATAFLFCVVMLYVFYLVRSDIQLERVK